MLLLPIRGAGGSCISAGGYDSIRNVSNSTKKRSGFWKGPDGLRAGWGILVFMLIFVAVALIIFALAYWLRVFTAEELQGLQTRIIPRVAIPLSIAESSGLLVAYFVVGWLDGRSWRDHGLRPARALVHFVQGVLTGVLLMSLLVAALVLSHALRTGPSGRPPAEIVWSGLQWAALFLPAAFFEEMVFRGYPFFRTARAIGPLRAAVVMSLAFALAHLLNGGETPIGLLQVVVIGLVFNLAVWRTGALWWAIGVHAAWNWTQTFVFGCNNSGLAGGGQWLVSVPAGPIWLSGGSTGPEGSLLVLPVMALAVWIVLRTLPVEPPEAPPEVKTASP
jgi:membrane protease YdiL (CAAX protease family)